MKGKARDILFAATTASMLASMIYLYDNEKPLLDYMKYLPVYRVEQLWERREQKTVPAARSMPSG